MANNGSPDIVFIKTESGFVVVKDPAEGSDELFELPTNPENNNLALHTLEHTFPGAYGLKYRNPTTGAMRALLLDSKGEEFLPPADGWSDKIFNVVLKPKIEGESGGDAQKRKRVRNNDSEGSLNSNDPATNNNNGGGEYEAESENKKKKKLLDKALCSDLIVLGLPYKTTEDELREYFLEFGDVVLCEIKTNSKGESRGFGFVKMADYEAQINILSKFSHIIGDRKCQVRMPIPKGGDPMEPNLNINPKLFIGRLQEKTKKEDLTEYFLKHAHRIDKKASILDVYIPKPFRGFGFITFSSPTVAKELIRQADFIIDGYSVSVSAAAPKVDSKFESKHGGGGYRHSGSHSRIPPFANSTYDRPIHSDRYYEGGRGPRGGPRAPIIKDNWYNEREPVDRYAFPSPPLQASSAGYGYGSHEELVNSQLQQATMSNLNQEVVNAALKAFWSVAGGSGGGGTSQNPQPSNDANSSVWR